MSIKMTEANKQIFSRLMEFVRQKGDKTRFSNDELDKIRYISTNDEEKQWLKNLNIQKQNQRFILPRIKAALMDFSGKNYFVIVGWNENDVDDIDDSLSLIDLNSGIVTAILSNFWLGFCIGMG
jgi:hypothetical protein